MKKNLIKKYILITIGTISFIAGVIGIILPIMPTTPFMLFTAYCYIKSSKKLYLILVKNKVFGKYILEYTEGEGKIIEKNIKIIAILFVWIDIIGIFVLLKTTPIKIAAFLVGVIITIIIIKIKKIKIMIVK